MSLNKFTDIEKGKSLGLQIGCETLDCSNLVSESITFPDGGDLNAYDINVSNNLKVATSNGDVNYTTPNKGQPDYSLRTDGAGNTFWAPDDTADLNSKTQNIDLAGTVSNTTQLNGGLKFNNTSTVVLKRRTDTDLQLQGATRSNFTLVGEDVTGIRTAFGMRSGGDGVFMQYSKVANTNPGNNLCIAHQGSPCDARFFRDGSVYLGNDFEYNEASHDGKENGVHIQANTASTSTTTGALKVAGGVGISGNLSVSTINNKPFNNYGQWSQLGNLDVALTATGVEFDLTGSGVGTLTIPSDEMIAGASWHVKLGGTLNTGDKDDITFKTYWIDPLAVQPDQLIFDSAPIDLADTGGANQQWEYEFDFTIRSAGASGTMYSNNQLIYSKAQTENSGRVASKWQNTTGLDMTYNQNWKFTIEWNTSASPHTIINRMVRIQKVF